MLTINVKNKAILKSKFYLITTDIYTLGGDLGPVFSGTGPVGTVTHVHFWTRVTI